MFWKVEDNYVCFGSTIVLLSKESCDRIYQICPEYLYEEKNIGLSNW